MGKNLGDGFLCYSKMRRRAFRLMACFEINRDIPFYTSECPIRQMLYILQAGPFAAVIKGNPNVQGIHLRSRAGYGIEAKLNMFADDTQLINKPERLQRIENRGRLPYQ